MARFVSFKCFLVLILLSNEMKLSQTSSTEDPGLPTPSQVTQSKLKFNCTNGVVSNISGIDLKNVIVYEDGKFSHIIGKDVKTTFNKTKLHIIYNKKENDAHIIAGSGTEYYEIDCSTTGFIAFASAMPLNIFSTMKPPYVNLHNTDQPPSIDLIIQDGNQKKLTTAVNVGDKLTLTVVGPAQYTVTPINCTASNGVNTDSYLLWNCTSYDNAIMSGEWISKDTNTSTEMYAFRFIDSTIVKIECYARLCPKAIPNCRNDTQACLKPSSRRRRREAEIDTRHISTGRDEVASATFVVKNMFESNGCAGFPTKFPIFITLVLFALSIRRSK